MRIHNVALWEKTYTLHDPSLLPQMEDWLFDPVALQEHQLIRNKSTGRQPAFIFQYNGKNLVLRHFWRGGLIGRVLNDTYMWLGLNRTRPVREWNLLTTLSQQHLPVPQPAALRIIRRGLRYQADLITVCLPRTQTLADRLSSSALNAATWQQIGATIAKLHRYGAYHADLNARNILLQDEQAGTYLIDWDRGHLRQPAAHWQQANLARLRRSLDKLSANLTPFHYQPSQFEDLLTGYRAEI